MSTRQSTRQKLAQYTPDEEQLLPFQLAIATYATALTVLASVMGTLLQKLARQLFNAAKTAFVLVCVYAAYYALTEMLARPMKYVIERVVEEAVSRGDLTERAENILSLAITLVIAYATYRIVKWATVGAMDALGAPNPEQTSVDEYLNGGEPTEADINPEHPLHESNQ